MNDTLNNTGSGKSKENLKAWIESHPREYGEMALGMGEADLLETFLMGQAAFLASITLLPLRKQFFTVKLLP